MLHRIHDFGELNRWDESGDFTTLYGLAFLLTRS